MTTFANEDSLPRVPLPTLEESCERFLAWCAPLLTAERAGGDRGGGGRVPPARTAPAARCTRRWSEYDATEGVHSWLDTFWPYRYLGRRDRIALNANFFFLFQDASAAAAQVERAAGLIAGAVDYKRQLDAGAHPAGRAARRGRSRWSRTSSCSPPPGSPAPSRTPSAAPYTDEWPGPSARTAHRGVLPRQHVPDGRARRGRRPAQPGRPRGGAARGHEGRRRAGRRRTPRSGHLTTKARAEWAAARESLLAGHPGNAAALDDVETALFCVCLEDFAPADTQEACDQLLHGDSGNRWFDKAVSLIVFADGTAGINVEHCGLDGTTILSFVDALLGTPAEEQSRQLGRPPPGRCRPSSPSTSCSTTRLRAEVRAAAEAFAEYAARHRHHAPSPSTTSAARTRQGSCGISPDAFVQMAYQLAHQRAKGHLGATYESIATRQYRHGRTEAMRVVTPEMLRFVAAMEDPAADAGRPAGPRSGPPPTQHVARAKECQAGAGARAAPVGAAADPAAARRGTRRDRAARPVRHPGLADDARRLPEHQLGAVRQHPVLRLRLDQQPLHRRRLRPAARPLQPLPEHPAAGGRTRCTPSPTELREAVAELRELLAPGQPGA